MRHEKILRREDGSRVKITVHLNADLYSSRDTWETSVSLCAKGKRTWRSTYNENDFEYRGLSMEERTAHRASQDMQHVTSDELIEACLELWNQIKPGGCIR